MLNSISFFTSKTKQLIYKYKVSVHFISLQFLLYENYFINFHVPNISSICCSKGFLFLSNIYKLLLKLTNIQNLQKITSWFGPGIISWIGFIFWHNKIKKITNNNFHMLIYFFWCPNNIHFKNLLCFKPAFFSGIIDYNAVKR